MITLSIVVPVYSGAAYLDKVLAEVSKLKEELIEAQAPLEVRELIFVDDSAIDHSPQKIDELAHAHSWVRAIHLSRNFGQHPATIAGILYSSGDWVVTMDEDLQHPPSRIPEMLSVVAGTHADIVYGKPSDEVHQSITRDFTSKNFKRLIERLTGNPDIRKVSSFRLIRGEIARAASSVCGHDTYFDVALAWYTKRIETVLMPLKDDRYIQTGKSGYNFKALLSHARRMAASSQIKVLRAGGLLGMAVLVGTFILSLFLIILKVFAGAYIGQQGWTSLMLTICFFSGVILLICGIMLEYLSLLVMRAHGKPLFFVIDRSKDEMLNPYFGKDH